VSRLLQGGLIVLFVVVVGLVVGTLSAGYQETTAPASSSYTRCTTANNFTSCQDVGKSSFLASVFESSILPFPTDDSEFSIFLNGVWLLIMGFLLVVGVLLIVLSFVPTLGT